jgi:hypothetical protein
VDILVHTSPARARALGAAARQRVLAHHTGAHRALELESHLQPLLSIQVGKERSETGRPCRASKLAPKQPAGAMQQKMASHSPALSGITD